MIVLYLIIAINLAVLALFIAVLALFLVVAMLMDLIKQYRRN